MATKPPTRYDLVSDFSNMSLFSSLPSGNRTLGSLKIADGSRFPQMEVSYSGIPQSSSIVGIFHYTPCILDHFGEKKTPWKTPYGDLDIRYPKTKYGYLWYL